MKIQNKVKRILIILAVSLLIVVADSASADQVILNPNGVGYIDDLDPTPGAWANWQTVVTDDGDTSFVGTGSVNWLTDLYNLEDPAVSGTINSVTVYVKARAARTPNLTGLTTAIRTGDVTYYGGEKSLSTTYMEYDTEYSTNPKTLTAWTWAEINALQAGIQLRRSHTPGGGPVWSRATQVYVVVDYTPLDYEGLSHGYWKNHLDDWTVTGYSPVQTLGSVFTESSSLGLDGCTLLEALNFQGGNTLQEKAKILLRNAVASLLNAAHPNINYPLLLTDVITDVNAALASGDADTMLELEVILDGYNNLGGDLSS